MGKSDGIFNEIRKVVARIPVGKVATYGQIANIVGMKDARKVGWALHGNQDPKIPCHRVLRKDGTCAESFSLGGWQEQKFRLEKEGVEFIANNKLELARYLWKPRV